MQNKQSRQLNRRSKLQITLKKLQKKQRKKQIV